MAPARRRRQVRTPRSRGTRPHPERRGKHRSAGASFLRETVIILVSALVLSLIVKTFLVQAFFIPSGSMNDTLIENDRILVSKLTPGPFDLHRGDIVVFKDPNDWLGDEPEDTPTRRRRHACVRDALTFVGLYPEDAGEHLVKRVIGLPGRPRRVRGRRQAGHGQRRRDRRAVPGTRRASRASSRSTSSCRPTACGSWATTGSTRPTRGGTRASPAAAPCRSTTSSARPSSSCGRRPLGRPAQPGRRRSRTCRDRVMTVTRPAAASPSPVHPRRRAPVRTCGTSAPCCATARGSSPGMDEVGRGSLAGPVSVGVVVVDVDHAVGAARRRRLQAAHAAARSALLPALGRWGVARAVGHASAAEIDEIGHHRRPAAGRDPRARRGVAVARARRRGGARRLARLAHARPRSRACSTTLSAAARRGAARPPARQGRPRRARASPRRACSPSASATR